MQCPKAIESENFSELRHKFAEHVAATEQFSAIHSRDISFAHNINKRQHNVEQLASQDSRHRSYSVDDSSSFIGEDILKASQVQLVRIREQRASTLAQRLEQKQEALWLAEQTRLNALHEVRHRAAMEIGARCHARRRCWTAVKYMYNSVKLRSNYTLAEFKWKVVSIMSVFQKLARHVHINSCSDAPYLALRTRAGWRRLQARTVERAEEHMRDVEGELIAHHFLIQRHCRRVLRELYRTVRRKALTMALIDSYRTDTCCRQAFAVLRRRLLGRHQHRMERLGKLLIVQRGQLRIALLELARHALRSRRNRAVVEEDVYSKLSAAMHAWKSGGRGRARVAFAHTEAVLQYRERRCGWAVTHWHRAVVVRSHLRSSQKAAVLHRSDISARGNQFWIREEARKCLLKWYDRMAFNRTRLLPANRLKSKHAKKFRNKVIALLRAWKQRVAKNKVKRLMNGVKVSRARLRAGWLWFRGTLRTYSVRARRQRDAYAKPRRLRTKHLAEAFAEFLAFVRRNKARRLAVRRERVLRQVADMTGFISRLYLRMHTRNKRRAATEARFVSFVRHSFRHWRGVAQRKLRARAQTGLRRLREGRLEQGWQAWVQYTTIRSQRRVEARTAKRALYCGRRKEALQSWIEKTARGIHDTSQLRRALRQHYLSLAGLGWLQWQSYVASRAAVAERGVHTVLPCQARRVTFLRRWVQFLIEAKEKRAFVRHFSREREGKQARAVLWRLQEAVVRRLEAAQVQRDFQSAVAGPLLLRRALGKMIARHEDSIWCRSDPRLQHHGHRASRVALRRWRDYRKDRQQGARVLRLGDRQRKVVSALHALSHWRYIAQLHHNLVEAARQAARLYRRKYYAPAFKNWLRNTAALAHQFDARYLQHGDVFRKAHARRVLSAFRRNRLRHRRIQSNKVASKTHRDRALCHKGWHQFCDAFISTKHYKGMKATALKHRSLFVNRCVFDALLSTSAQHRREKVLSLAADRKHAAALKRRVFEVFRAIFVASETPGYRKACRVHSKRVLRQAVQLMRLHVAWRKHSRRGLIFQKNALQASGMRAWRAWKRHRRFLQSLSAQRATPHRKRVLCRRYLAHWVSVSCARRGVSKLFAAIARTRTRTGSDLSSTVSAALVSLPSGAAVAGSTGLERRLSFSLGSSSPSKSLSRSPAKKTWRRPVVNPDGFLRQRRLTLALKAMRAHTATSAFDRKLSENAQHSIEEHRLHLHFTQWTAWTHDAAAMALHRKSSDVHMAAFRTAKCMAPLRRIVRQHNHEKAAHASYLHALVLRGWQRWTKYAYTGLRRARAQAKAQRRAQLKQKETQQSKKGNPQYLDDDFPARNIAQRVEQQEEEAADVLDHRVSVQRAQWRRGEVMHLVHAAVHALARWRHWYRMQYHNFKVVHLCQHRQQEAMLRRLQENLTRRQHHRTAVRTSKKWRRHHLLSLSFALIKLNRRLCVAVRQLRRARLAKVVGAWKAKMQFRGRAIHSLLVLEDLRRSQLLRAAFSEWVADTAVESMLVTGLGDLRRHRLHHGVDHLVYRCRFRRHHSALLLRSRKHRTYRLLRKVFKNMLAEMAGRYRCIEVMRDCSRYHDQYHCRRVIYNLFYLRRNRIAKDHNLHRRFRALIAALRVNTGVVRFAKRNMAAANTVILRKTLLRLRRLARENKSRSRKLRTLHCAAAPRGRLHHSPALVAVNRRNLLQLGLRALRQNATRHRRQTKQLRWCSRFCLQRTVYRGFRHLLSYARKRNLKRRNNNTLCELFVSLQMRRAVSRLDMNVSSKWARLQERRLMDVHAEAHSKKHALCVLQQRSVALRGERQLEWPMVEAHDESKGEMLFSYAQ